MKILIAEDNSHKGKKIRELVLDTNPSVECVEACSFTSAWRAILESKIDFAILDMSLPTYDIKEGDSGGNFRTFGGKEIARKIFRRSLPVKFVFLTQYEIFNDISGTQSLDSIDKEMAELYPENHKGVILFDATNVQWKEVLANLIKDEFSL